MSWYYNNINGYKAKHPQPPHNTFHAGLYSTQTIIRNIVYTMKITDMKSSEDADRITEALLKLEGVRDVKPILHQNKLSITFCPSETSLANVAHTISNLGYHYIQRRCKCCG